MRIVERYIREGAPDQVGRSRIINSSRSSIILCVMDISPDPIQCLRFTADDTLETTTGSQLASFWHSSGRYYRQVNISGECREKILGTDVMAFDIFDEARAEVLALMEVRRSFGARDERFKYIYACDIWWNSNPCFWTISIARRYACPSKWMCA